MSDSGVQVAFHPRAFASLVPAPPPRLMRGKRRISFDNRAVGLLTGAHPRDTPSPDVPSIPPPRSLEHPLPGGMRDLLPEEARSRRALARRVLDRFALAGYALVTPPAFEFADVLERGLGTLDPADVLRFVEPESGEVAALRPDMTPQIARMIATRLHDRPPPFRLGYEGTVLRRRSGRARKHRQIPQVGVELAGVTGPDGDLELLALAEGALAAAGLERFTIDLGTPGSGARS